MKINFADYQKKVTIDMSVELMSEVVYFKISREEYDNYKKLLLEMREQTNSKKPISLSTLNELEALFIPVQEKNNEELNKLTNERVRIVKEKFKECDVPLIGFGLSGPKVYTLEYIIHSAIEATSLKMLLDKTDKKLDCLEICYGILSCFRQILIGDSKKNLSHYRITAMAGYITLLLGIGISKEFIPEILEQNPSNRSIYEAIKKATKKYRCEDT